jgi:hypothetical protein
VPESVVSVLGVVVDKKNYGLQTIVLRNRLDMDIKVDVRHLLIKNEVVVLVRANDAYHRTSVSKNIEHIAFQLKDLFAREGLGFSIVEYADRHHKADSADEWWQWRFNWVGRTALSGQRYLLSQSKIDVIQLSLFNANAELQQVS